CSGVQRGLSGTGPSHSSVRKLSSERRLSFGGGGSRRTGSGSERSGRRSRSRSSWKMGMVKSQNHSEAAVLRGWAAVGYHENSPSVVTCRSRIVGREQASDGHLTYETQGWASRRGRCRRLWLIRVACRGGYRGLDWGRS